MKREELIEAHRVAEAQRQSDEMLRALGRKALAAGDGSLYLTPGDNTKALAKRRAKNKVARKSRKINRGK